MPENSNLRWYSFQGGLQPDKTLPVAREPSKHTCPEECFPL